MTRPPVPDLPPDLPPEYAEAYRRCDNRAERERQIDLIVDVGRHVEGLVRLPAVGLALRLARVPARLAGWREHHDFLERGFEAFKNLKGAEDFLRVVADREARELVAGEIDELRDAARQHREIGATASADTLTRQAELLEQILTPHP